MKALFITLSTLFFIPLSLYAAQVVDIEIEGMSCKFCAYSVQKNLSGLPGVAKAEVNIDDNRAYIVMSQGQEANIEQLKKKIVESGFTPLKVTLNSNEKQ